MSGRLPESWAVVPLGVVAEVQLGKMLSAKSRSGQDGRPYLRNVNVRWHRIDVDDVLTMDFDAREVDKYRLQRGDVLVCEGGEPGRAAIWQEQLDGALYQKALHRVRFRDGALDPKLFTHYLELVAEIGTLADRFTGSTIKHLPRESFVELRVPIPPSEEQRRIVAALEEHLSEIDAAVLGLQRARANVGRHTASVLWSAVAGTLITSVAERSTFTINEMGEVVTGTTPPTGEPENYDGDLPFFKPADLNAGYHVREAREHLTVRGTNYARRLPAGTVLVTCIGATIGKCGLARVACATNQQINAVIPNTSTVLPEFLFLLLASPQGQTSIKSNASATTLPILNKSKFSTLRFDVPEIDAQRAIVADVEHRLAVADRTSAAIDVQLARARRLRQSILQRAYEGKLVPQDPMDEPARALLDRISAERTADETNAAGAPRRRRVRSAKR